MLFLIDSIFRSLLRIHCWLMIWHLCLPLHARFLANYSEIFHTNFGVYIIVDYLVCSTSLIISQYSFMAEGEVTALWKRWIILSSNDGYDLGHPEVPKWYHLFISICSQPNIVFIWFCLVMRWWRYHLLIIITTNHRNKRLRLKSQYSIFECKKADYCRT